MKIALFDFDGTITSRDTLFDFIKFSVGNRKYYYGIMLLTPIFIAFKLKMISNHTAKEKLISYFFAGYERNRFKNISDNYSKNRIENIVKKKAIETIVWHQQQGHKVVVVTASIECWLKQWCKKNNIDLIGTKLEVKNNKITGRFKTRNCHGIEKVNRIREKYNLSMFDEIYAYGDSRGDKEMLELANNAYFKPFQ
ncbi:HAD-IB family hydrolase [Aliikangiella maris]|uniref:HAD-IB family hydrolase n=2 Tax=Aliikangiella maris TaxID=3162458 RepID=A0ABV3MP26_9GAMM